MIVTEEALVESIGDAAVTNPDYVVGPNVRIGGYKPSRRPWG